MRLRCIKYVTQRVVYSMFITKKGVDEIEKFNTYSMCLPLELHGEIVFSRNTVRCRLYWSIIMFMNCTYSQSCWYVRPSFVNYCLTSLVHLPPFPKSKYVYTGSKWLFGGRGLSCVGDHSLQEFNTLFLTRFRTYKIASSDKVPLQANIFLYLTFDIAVYQWVQAYPPSPPPPWSRLYLFLSFFFLLLTLYRCRVPCLCQAGGAG